MDTPLNQWHNVALDDDGRVSYLGFFSYNCRGNNMEIPLDKIAKLTELTSLRIEGDTEGTSGFSGNISSDVGKLTKLKDLRIVFNEGLSGTIPKEIGNLTNLESLDFGMNNLTGSIPNEITNLRKCRMLNLSDNSLTGVIPPNIGDMQNLNQLLLMNNNLTGEIPSSIGNLRMLTLLYLDNCNFTGNIPSSLSNLEFLEEFYCSFNKLSGEIPIGVMLHPNFDKWSPAMKILPQQKAPGLTLPSNGFSGYTSSDYSKDGDVTKLYTATKGKGIDLVLWEIILLIKICRQVANMRHS